MNERYVLNKISNYFYADEYFVYHIIAKLVKDNSHFNDIFLILTNKRLFVAVVETKKLNIHFTNYRNINPKYLYNKNTNTYRIIGLFNNEIIEFNKYFNQIEQVNTLREFLDEAINIGYINRKYPLQIDEYIQKTNFFVLNGEISNSNKIHNNYKDKSFHNSYKIQKLKKKNKRNRSRKYKRNIAIGIYVLIFIGILDVIAISNFEAPPSSNEEIVYEECKSALKNLHETSTNNYQFREFHLSEDSKKHVYKFDKDTYSLAMQVPNTVTVGNNSNDFEGEVICVVAPKDKDDKLKYFQTLGDTHKESIGYVYDTVKDKAIYLDDHNGKLNEIPKEKINDSEAFNFDIIINGKEIYPHESVDELKNLGFQIDVDMNGDKVAPNPQLINSNYGYIYVSLNNKRIFTSNIVNFDGITKNYEYCHLFDFKPEIGQQVQLTNGIKTGMTRDEVMNILGDNYYENKDNILKYAYKDETHGLEVSMLKLEFDSNNKLSSLKTSFVSPVMDRI